MASPSYSGIQSVKLEGHQGAVLCLDHNTSNVGNASGSDNLTEGCLLSGSEDGTARLWDLRSSPKAATCIVAGEEVTSVAFGQPSSPLQTESSEGSGFCRDFTVYLSVGMNLLGYDLRKADAPVIREASETLLEAEDDINQIVIGRQTFLAAADDTGVVQVLDGIDGTSKKGKKNSRKRVLQHGQDTLVTSCVFRPRSKNLELASGGTDCQICLWDVNKPKRPLSCKKITLDQSGAQLCNPPMVHSLAWSPSGRLLASGLGDGTSSVFLIENRSLVEVARLQNPDGDTPVASVLFPSFLPSTSKQQQHATEQDRLLALIRNDAVISFWDLGCTVAGEKAIHPFKALSRHLATDKVADATQVAESLDELSLVADHPKLLFKIPHQDKPNWMASSSRTEKHFPSSIFVADTTPDITAYTIPLI